MVVQASIDEAFVLHAAPPGGDLPISLGMQSATRMQQDVLRATGLHVSVGVARNKLLAKLTSVAAKPHGVKVRFLCVLLNVFLF